MMLRGILREAHAFWPEYIAHHTHPMNRALHYAADLAVAVGVVASLASSSLAPALFGGAAGLALVTVGHTLVEGNAPLVFRRPIVATMCNVAMAWRALAHARNHFGSGVGRGGGYDARTRTTAAATSSRVAGPPNV